MFKRLLYQANSVCLVGAIAVALLATDGLYSIQHVASASAEIERTTRTLAETGALVSCATVSDGDSSGPQCLAGNCSSTDFACSVTTRDATQHRSPEDLDPGAHRLVFSPYDGGSFLGEYYDDRTSWAQFDAVAATGNAGVQEGAAGVQSGGMIAGNITSAETGTSLAGINVCIYSEFGQPTGKCVAADAAGNYLIGDLSSGKYQVCYGSVSSEPLVYQPHCSDIVTVEEGSLTDEIDIALSLGGRISGRVTSGLTGEPLAGIEVRAQYEGEGSVPARVALADAAGTYTVTGLAGGSYSVYFNSKYAGGYFYLGEYYNHRDSTQTADPVVTKAGITTLDIDAVLAYRPTIRGDVYIDGSPDPAEGIVATAYDSSGNIAGFSTTGQEDIYLGDSSSFLLVLEPGKYRIEFRGHDFVAPYYESKAYFEEADWVTVTAESVLPELDVSLIRQPNDSWWVATAATRSGVFLTTNTADPIPLFTLDGGRNWQRFVTLPWSGPMTDTQVAVVPKDDPAQPVRFILASSLSSSEMVRGIHRTGDKGVTWSQFMPCYTGAPSRAGGTYDRVASPSDFDFPNGIYDLVTSPADSQRLYSAMQCSSCGFLGCFSHWRFITSPDGGVNWLTQIDDRFRDWPTHGGLLPSPVLPQRLYARRGTLGPWERSDDAGQTWLTEGFAADDLALDWIDPARIYRVNESGSNVFRFVGGRSADTGATWTEWAQQPCRTSFRQLLAVPEANTLLLRCDQGVYRSRDGGDSWERITTQSGGALVVPAGDRDLLVWARGGELWTSRDQGDTWSLLARGHALYLPHVRQ